MGPHFVHGIYWVCKDSRLRVHIQSPWYVCKLSAVALKLIRAFQCHARRVQALRECLPEPGIVKNYRYYWSQLVNIAIVSYTENNRLQIMI